MAPKRLIDERDIDDLLSALTDRQIAELFDLSEKEVATMRRQRRDAPLTHRARTNGSGPATED